MEVLDCLSRLMEGEMDVGPRKMNWGTWEELILGGAVRRHGTRDWNVVASELRARTVYPYCFTPEVYTYLRYVPLSHYDSDNTSFVYILVCS